MERIVSWSGHATAAARIVGGLVLCACTMTPAQPTASPPVAGETPTAPAITPTLAPATPTATTAATATATAEAVQFPPTSSALEPGSYFTFVQRHRVTLDVPAEGWSSFEHWALTKNNTDPPDGAFLMFHGAVTNVYTDACRWMSNAMNPPPGPTVDEFAEAFASVKDRDVSEPVDVVVGGHSGKFMQVTVPADVDFDSCDGDTFMTIRARDYNIWHISPGESWDVWILDVDGNRFFINSIYYPGTPSETVDELNEMLQSVEIEPIGQ